MSARADDLPFDKRRVEYDDTWSDAEWDDIIAATQDDVDAERYAFSTEDYPSHEEGMAALCRPIHDRLRISGARGRTTFGRRRRPRRAA